MPRVLYFTLGTPDQCREFFARFDPRASAVSNPKAEFYESFSLERGDAPSFLATAVLGSGLRVLLKGHLPGKPVGDVRRMPGVFLVQDTVVRAKHIAQNAADQPDLPEIARLAAQLRSGPTRATP